MSGFYDVTTVLAKEVFDSKIVSDLHPQHRLDLWTLLAVRSLCLHALARLCVPFCVLHRDGRLQLHVTLVAGHRAQILAIDWWRTSPFLLPWSPVF